MRVLEHLHCLFSVQKQITLKLSGFYGCSVIRWVLFLDDTV